MCTVGCSDLLLFMLLLVEEYQGWAKAYGGKFGPVRQLKIQKVFWIFTEALVGRGFIFLLNL